MREQRQTWTLKRTALEEKKMQTHGLAMGQDEERREQNDAIVG